MRIAIILLCTLTSYSYGQVSKENLLGKWSLLTFHVDSTLIVDVQNPMNVVSQNMYQLKKANPDYSSTDSIEYVNQIITGLKPFDNYFIEFHKNGTYRNSKIIRGRVTQDIEEGQFILVESAQTLIQVDKEKRTSENKIELSNKSLRLFIEIGDKKTIMTFKKNGENAR
jgi:hypothetical protein